MKDYIDVLDRHFPNDDAELLDEAGNISSAVAMRKYNSVLKLGKRVVSSGSATEDDKLIAKMLVDVAGLSLMSVASSGGKSFMSTVAKLSTLRGL